MTQNTRNHPVEFARRTLKNLRAIEAMKSQNRDVHVVTQLGLSLLGLIVFPEAKQVLPEAETKTWAVMKGEGWPLWVIEEDNPRASDKYGKTQTLADIIRHVRNAIAHGQVTFTSDSPDENDVAIIVEDRYLSKPPAAPYWRARMEVRDLRVFCERLLPLIEESTR